MNGTRIVSQRESQLEMEQTEKSFIKIIWCNSRRREAACVFSTPVSFQLPRLADAITKYEMYVILSMFLAFVIRILFLW